MILKLESRREVEEVARALRPLFSLDEYVEKVKPIVEDVRKRGDRAVVEYAEKLDGVKLEPRDIYIGENALLESLERVEEEKPELAEALRKLAERVRLVEELLASQILGKTLRVCVSESVCVYQELKPLSSAACYVPGGLAPYVSTAVMCGVAAGIAGVRRLVAFAPPRSAKPSLLAALALAGFRGLYRAGGAYGVAALAYGTESIERVDKIAGPGGLYYTAAKIVVSRDVGVDMLAGPTELVVYVDKPGLERELALHLAAQAEHGESSMTVAVTTSMDIAKEILEFYESLRLDYEKRTGRRLASLKVVVSGSRELAVDLINSIAPEHVEVCSDSPEVSESLVNYGVLVDGCVSSAINDYYSGANHILPTSGWARWRGGLSVLDFLVLRRRVSIRGAPRGLSGIAEEVAPIAREEGFELHLESLRVTARG